MDFAKKKKENYLNENWMRGEIQRLGRSTNRRLELAEVRQNLWRCYRDGKNQRLVKPTTIKKISWPPTQGNAPGKLDLNKYLMGEQVRREEKERELAHHWRQVETCMDFIEQNYDFWDEFDISSQLVENEIDQNRLISKNKQLRKWP